MARGETVERANDDRSSIEAELLNRPLDQATLNGVFVELWAELKGSRADFAVRTSAAFSYLGVCDEVRGLVGGVWGAAFRGWSSAEQIEFLRLLLSNEMVHRDLSFEFLPAAVPHLKLTAQEFWGWIGDSRPERGGYPHRLPEILKRYADVKPTEAFELADLFLRQPAGTGNARFVALLLYWVRENHPTGDIRQRVNEFEVLLASGPIDHRSILLESWAFAAGSPELDEAKAVDLKRRLVRGAAEELKSWCFLLQRVTLNAPEKLPWAVRELHAVAKTGVAGEQKYFVVVAALHGWLTAKATSPVSRTEWEALLRALAPLKADDNAAWDHFEYSLVDAFEKDAAGALALVALVAETSGTSWSKLMEENPDKFRWWCQTMNTAGHAESIVARLWLSNVRAARRVGFQIVRRCGVNAFGSSSIQRATAGEIERLLLEAAVNLAEYEFVGRVHLVFADRINNLGGRLEEWFYDEVLTQALNTNQYRQVILKGAPPTAKLHAAVKEAEQRIQKSEKASDSPALRMRIPGQTRAEALSMRRFGREVAKGFQKHSIFAQLAHTIQLLYGKSWRMPDATGALGAAANLMKSEAVTELPRLEFMTPEGMRHRRIMAMRRIVELDNGVDEVE